MNQRSNVHGTTQRLTPFLCIQRSNRRPTSCSSGSRNGATGPGPFPSGHEGTEARVTCSAARTRVKSPRERVSTERWHARANKTACISRYPGLAVMHRVAEAREVTIGYESLYRELALTTLGRLRTGKRSSSRGARKTRVLSILHAARKTMFAA